MPMLGEHVCLLGRVKINGAVKEHSSEKLKVEHSNHMDRWLFFFFDTESHHPLVKQELFGKQWNIALLQVGSVTWC